MTGTYWTGPELRAAIAAAQSGMAASEVRLHLNRVGYTLRTLAAVKLRLRKDGVATTGGGLPWTAAEVAALRRAYANGTSAPAACPQRTPPAIRWKAGYLGIRGTHPKPRGWAGKTWTPEQDAELAALYPTVRAREIAARLGRSLIAVRQRAQDISISSGYARPWSDDELRAIRLAHVHGLSMMDLADALNRDPSVISRQATRRMGLRFGRRINKAPNGRRSERVPLTFAGILALGGGAVSASRPAWSVLAGVPHCWTGQGAGRS